VAPALAVLSGRGPQGRVVDGGENSLVGSVFGGHAWAGKATAHASSGKRERRPSQR
jgi:hypothetical protein